MGFKLTPIVIAAIATASVASLLVLILLSRWLYRRFHSSSRSAAESHHTQNRNTFASCGLGYPTSASSEGNRHLMATPSSGSGMSLRTPVTPASSKLKKEQGTPKSSGGKSCKSSKSSGSATSRVTELERPESEMIMVTYEEGLAALGLGRPHHILYPDDPPQFDETVQAYPTAPPSSSISRTVPGRSGLRDGARAKGREDRARERQDRARAREQQTRQWARSPVARHAREGPGATGWPAIKESGRVQSTWLPSYYHSPEYRSKEMDEESDIVDVPGSREGKSQSRVERWVNRI